MHYHRVVVQLLTWAIVLAHRNGDKWDAVVYEAARNSFRFLRTCQDDATGWLPNYGNNDGALLFPLTDCHYRDYRPQLTALGKLLNLDPGYESGIWDEESQWLTGSENRMRPAPFQPAACSSFSNGGYFVLREAETLTFLRCTPYRHRPFQADNLHVDIWADGQNILRDAGSFQYQTEAQSAGFFAGSRSHNVIMLNGSDQMKKGARFIWYHWITQAFGKAYACGGGSNITAGFQGFRHRGSNIVHRRTVHKVAGMQMWVIDDRVDGVPAGLLAELLWHPGDRFFENYSISVRDSSGKLVPMREEEGWYSCFYGQKEPAKYLVYSSFGRTFHTVIQARFSN